MVRMVLLLADAIARTVCSSDRIANRLYYSLVRLPLLSRTVALPITRLSCRRCYVTHLVVENAKFGDTQQLTIDGVSFDLQSGEMLVLLGANGPAGKTTLLRLIANQLKLESGLISLDDQAIVSLSRRKLAQQIALMPQQENRTSTLTVSEVVSLGRMPHCGWFLHSHK